MSWRKACDLGSCFLFYVGVKAKGVVYRGPAGIWMFTFSLGVMLAPIMLTAHSVRYAHV